MHSNKWSILLCPKMKIKGRISGQESIHAYLAYLLLDLLTECQSKEILYSIASACPRLPTLSTHTCDSSSISYNLHR